MTTSTNPGTQSKRGVSGGRHLNAISDCDALTLYQKAILHEIAGQMNVGGEFVGEWRFYAHDWLARRTSTCRRQVLRILKGLIEDGYILSRPPTLQKKYTEYCLTKKVFEAQPVTNSHTTEEEGVTNSHTEVRPIVTPPVTNSHTEVRPIVTLTSSTRNMMNELPHKTSSSRAALARPHDDGGYPHWKARVDQTPFARVTESQIEELGLRKIHKMGLEPEELNARIAAFVQDAENGKWRGKVIRSGIALFMAEIFNQR